ncbi:hypothetical protein Anapl_01399 [Anas platyrhynchos]|uniref:Uncharacterized protein n=1 Tax=Anas platyrhynchos TaxID=8839 RepID=R0LVM4_ANAPL|nr:hypothetical protein Anapl_01399 [Anas platyrhynchos]
MTAWGPEMVGEGLRKRRTEEELELQIHGGRSSEALGGQMQWGGLREDQREDQEELSDWCVLFPKQLYQHVRQAASCNASAGGEKDVEKSGSHQPPESTLCPRRAKLGVSSEDNRCRAVLFLVSALCEFNGREVIPPAQQTDDTFCFPSGGKTPASGTEQS